ncbi:MAG: DUF554 domain-containing protein [Actinomycetota bacterium]|nr:DUF554 domain-containing protein [Actinomycetota bacterium]
MPGLGTLINIAAILIGSTIGVLVGHRFPERTRVSVTDALGLVVLVVGAMNLFAIADSDYRDAVTDAGTLLVVLFSILIGGIIGSLFRIEYRLELIGGWLQRRFTKGDEPRSRFIEGFVTASLVFCIGPLAILGSLSDGLGQGIEQLTLKSLLDGFASLAFASTFGWGVAASAISVGVFQGLITIIGFFAGSVMPAALIASITATGGVLLLGVGIRMLNIRAIAVGDLLPALVVAPILTAITASVLG